MSIAEKLQIVAENEQKVYEAGKKTQYDEFWDVFQNYGKKTHYAHAFSGYWNKETLRPKYDIVPTTMECMFKSDDPNYDVSYIYIDDLAQHFDDMGIKFDTSNCTEFKYAFTAKLRTKRLGVLDTTATNNLALQFIFWCPVETVDEVIVREDTVYNNYTFASTKLKHIKMSGVIGRSIYFQHSPLTPKSMISVISILKDYSQTEYRDVYEVKFTSGCWDALENHSSAPNGDTWKNYVISLGWLT